MIGLISKGKMQDSNYKEPNKIINNLEKSTEILDNIDLDLSSIGNELINCIFLLN